MNCERRPSVAAIILSYNEERHIRECMESIAWADEIWVVDSFSTDGTLDICRQYTSNIVQHAFQDFASQRNWALDNLPLAAEWVLFLDADERIPSELAREIRERLTADDGRYSGYYVPGKQYFWGQHLRFGTAAPNYNLKLFKKDAGRYTENKIIHEHLVIDGKVDYMTDARIVLAKDNLYEYIDRVNWYSNLESVHMFSTGEDMFSPRYRSYTRVNQVLKRIFSWLPLKPLAMFVYVYILRRGFRDGRRGLLYALMESFYVFASYAKLWEIRNGLVNSDQYRSRR